MVVCGLGLTEVYACNDFNRHSHHILIQQFVLELSFWATLKNHLLKIWQSSSDSFRLSQT